MNSWITMTPVLITIAKAHSEPGARYKELNIFKLEKGLVYPPRDDTVVLGWKRLGE
jgi:hypothetical protein